MPWGFGPGLLAVVATDFARHGAAVTASDLTGYEAERSIVVRGRFGELQLVGTYLPASGATPGLGFLHAATLGYLDRSEPGDRPWSSQSPIVALRDGRLAYVLGGAGGRRIVSALVQTLVRVELDGVPLEEAMAATRFHPTGRRHFEQVNSSRPPPGAEVARALGHTVLIRPFDSLLPAAERRGGGP